MEKKSGKANRSGNRVVRDLPLADAATPGVKGGSLSVSSSLSTLSTTVTGVVDKFAAALQTAARNA